ncbi:DUF1642 domain-containing protein [Lactococcus lactis]|uniref:DUF1642 domain-containing protein n=1 Tax=Lactococcus lactis TaxID=1358 RepID=UPI001F5B5E39|nr:DUF1642 domain-containing protein [Lactococcus lactis]WDA67635.1 DUF1642 domain-containing protein [Lactococcus lactis]
MTKFEEEVKRPDNTGIDPFSKRDVDFSKIAEKFTSGAQTLKSWRNYADYKEYQLEQKDEQIQSLAKMVDKLNGQIVDLKGELEEVRDLQGEANNQAAKEYIDRCEAESKLESIKSQLQQQALPVVPEFVVEWIECVKGKKNNALALLNDDNMPDNVNEWLFFQRNDDNINLILRAWLDGYTVEKPQLFYLKHELTGQFLAKDNHIKDEDRYFFWTGANPLTHSVGTAWKLTFTQSEIDRIQCGLEQIEVTE